MNISFILSATLVPTFVMFIISIVNKSNTVTPAKMNDKCFIIEFPKIIAAIGLIGNVIFLAVILCFTLFSPKLPHMIFYITFGFFIWIATYLILKTLKFKVIVLDQKIIVENLFRKPFEFTFSEITSVIRQTKNNQVKSERIVIKIDSGKKVVVEHLEISYNIFLKRIKEEVNSELLFGFE